MRDLIDLLTQELSADWDGDRYVLGRQNATQSILPAAIWQSAVMNNGTDIMFQNNGAGWAELTDQVYVSRSRPGLYYAF